MRILNLEQIRIMYKNLNFINHLDNRLDTNHTWLNLFVFQNLMMAVQFTIY